MEYYQQLNSYFTSQGYAPDAAAYLSNVTYYQAQQQALQPPPVSNEQAMIQQFMSLNDGQKMQFVQSWLLQNPQYFMKEKTAAPAT